MFFLHGTSCSGPDGVVRLLLLGLHQIVTLYHINTSLLVERLMPHFPHLIRVHLHCSCWETNPVFRCLHAPARIFMDNNCSGVRWRCCPNHHCCFFFPDGDGKWGLAGGRRPAGAGQDLLEGRTGPVPADAHRAQTEVQGDERRYELSLLRRLSANVLWEFLENECCGCFCI